MKRITRCVRTKDPMNFASNVRVFTKVLLCTHPLFRRENNTMRAEELFNTFTSDFDRTCSLLRNTCGSRGWTSSLSHKKGTRVTDERLSMSVPPRPWRNRDLSLRRSASAQPFFTCGHNLMLDSSMLTIKTGFLVGAAGLQKAAPLPAGRCLAAYPSSQLEHPGGVRF